MNEFVNKHNPKERRSGSVDGFSSRPKTRFDTPAGSLGPRFRDVNQTSSSPRGSVQDFKRPDGLHANAQQRIQPGRTPAPSPEPIVIDRKAPKRSGKRGLFGRKKNRDGEVLRKQPWSFKRKFFTTCAVLIIIIAAIVGFLFAKGFISLHKVLQGGGGAAALQQNVDPTKLKGEGDGRVNILLLGRGGEGHEGADLTDTIILASIDPIAKEASLVSIPRDLYVNIPGSGSMKINSVFATGKDISNAKVKRRTNDTDKQADDKGFSLLEETIEKSFGVPVHYHAMIDFTGFEQAINTVGGITVNAPNAVTEQMRIKGKNYKLDVKPGVQQMDGFKALAYSRSRYTSARGDFDRSERQRLIITALKEKVFTVGTFGNPQKISQLLGNFGSHVQTNFAVGDLQRLYDLSKEINNSKISSIGLADPPNNFLTTSNIDGQSVVIPTAGVGNFKDIQNFMRNALKDSYLKNENSSVMVLNGTTKAGLATTKGDELKSFGYNVTKVDNAPTKNYPKTVVVDLRGGTKKYTKNYLEKRYGVSAVTTIPDPAIVPGTADFVIIIGNDQVTN